jgi:methylthioribulose-1-phosphate dehydratase
MTVVDTLDALIQVVIALAAQGLSPATGGNFSLRADEDHFCITASGRDKRTLSTEDFIHAAVHAPLPTTSPMPSAEAALHQRLYRLDATIGCVLHTHSVAATVLSRLALVDRLQFEGYEMQKAIRGQATHEQVIALPIFENTQDISALADSLAQRWAQAAPPYGFLVRGHGLYAWGTSVAEARRHVEGWEFLMQCRLTERLLEGRA